MTDQTSPTGEWNQPQPTGVHDAEAEQSATEQSAPAKTPKPRADENGVPYGIGPFTLREIVFLGLTVIVLVASFLPIVGGVFVGYPQNLWAPFGWFVIPGVLLMLAAAVLVVLRRLVPSFGWRVGSLSVDQFSSVTVIVTVSFYFGMLIFIASLPGLLGAAIFPGAGIIVGFVASVLALAVTTFATFIPPFRDDFGIRPETPAHRLARTVIPVPRRPKPEPTEHAPFAGEAAAYSETVGYDPFAAPYPPAQPEPVGPRYARTSTIWPDEPDETITLADVAPPPETENLPDELPDTSDTSIAGVAAADAVLADEAVASLTGTDRTEEPPASDPEFADEFLDESEIETQALPRSAFSHVSSAVAPEADEATTPPALSTQPFWVYSAVPRTVVDQATGSPLFEIGPSAWALAIVDRGTELVIRHDDGRVGVLRHVDGLMRG